MKAEQPNERPVHPAMSSKSPMTVTTIGSIEYIDLPEVSLQSVPAKIDTGADSSAIWATNVQEAEGVLSYVLFDKTSPFYTGEVLQSHNYTVSTIKNSFGHTESRYKVRLMLTIAGRTVRARFTLANRANNRFPLLIGRRTLQGKFLVDVSKKGYINQPRILLLSRSRTPSIEAFTGGVEALLEGASITYVTYDDVQFSIRDGIVRVVLRDSEQDVADFDLVYFKVAAGKRDVAAAIAYYLKKRNVPFFDSAVSSYSATSKLYQYVVLTENSITVPPSLFIAATHVPKSYQVIKKALGVPFVMKDIHIDKGQNNFLVTNEQDFKRVCRQVAEADLQMICQTFIPNDGDYRVLVMGDRIRLLIYRSRRPGGGSHLNNTSQGGQAELATVQTTLPVNIQAACLRAAKLLDRKIAGVDMMADKETGSWYCLEVNDSPQLASGTFLAEKRTAFANFIKSELEK